MVTLISRRAFLGSIAAAGAAAAAAGTPQLASATELGRVARVSIHPAVGFARVGNSRDAFYFGPDVVGQLPRGPFKDAKGAMAKQAARFRIYGYDAQGRVLGEVTSAEASIEWRVDVANTKAAWYSIDEAFDIPDSPSVPLRNADVADRSSLVVHATPRRLRGGGAGPLPLDGGYFAGRAVTLGEVLTDERGRLVVMPGSGEAYSVPGADPLGGFADNDGWTDNTCDGPIRATVRIGGRTLEAEPAWVVCASPNYAPGIPAGLVTLHDSVESALFEAGRMPFGATDFTRDVWPIFERITDLQWVNAGYLDSHGFGSLQDWTQQRWRERLADATTVNEPFRRMVADGFRDPAFTEVQPTLEPQMYGDAVTMPPNLVEPRQWLALTPLQYRHLKAWARGDFTDRRRPVVTRLSDVPLDEQPATLDKASMNACLGGAFHPGVEFPWIARVDWLWTSDLRLRLGSTSPDAGNWGPELTSATALSRRGPLSKLGPGGVTQWMGVPWHADSASCRVGYQKALSLVLPGFWPARIPNHVLSEADYRIVVDTDRTLDERRRAFRTRREWERFIAQPTRPPTLALMVREWFKQGVVRDRPGPTDGRFPSRMKVESDAGYDVEPPTEYGAWMWVPQLPMFPFVVANSNDNSLRSVDRRGRQVPLSLSAALGRPEGITRDGSGNLYVCCLDANIVARVTPTGVVSTFAQGLENPVSITIDGEGNLYVANYTTAGWIAKITPSGDASTLVAPSAGLVQPIGLVMSPDGALLVSNAGPGTVARVDPVSGAVLDPAWIAGLDGPRGMVFDASFHLYLGVRWTNTVNRYDVDGNALPLTFTGTALGEPFGVAVDASNRIYVSNSARNVVNRIVVSGDSGVVSDFATGLPNPGGIVFNG